ncbi:hypothetical protein DVT68_10545 [Dyella solisilvae]|uniref:Uncharacterized protein n=1 Tax=Dyella solisilvae TaxID=1920168 RepID=A0A370K8E7_9GAMM|nr:hypothetical protein [Dyella solisilvae]RDI98926.1 hypothetical protein DVT68_10545 [Dyella solisilvae]
MSDNADRESEGLIILKLADACENSGRIPLTEVDINKFGGVRPVYRALRKALGARFSALVLDGAEVRMQVRPNEHDGTPYDLTTFAVDTEATAIEVQANGDLARPLPIAQVVKRLDLVAVIQAVSRARHVFGLDVFAVCAGEARKLPVLPPAAFTQPDPDSELRKEGSFAIKGLVRDDQRGHQLLVTDGEHRVQLPRDDPRWTWAEIGHILDRQAMLVGALVRGSKAQLWTVDDATRLET